MHSCSWPTSIQRVYVYLKLYFLFSGQKFLIVGGAYGILTTEVIDFESSSEVTSFGDIPSEKYYAVGGLLGSFPILCGGDSSDSCFTLKNSQWTETHKMATERGFAASIQIDPTTLWIMGGSDGSRHDSTEFVVLDSTQHSPARVQTNFFGHALNM